MKRIIWVLIAAIIFAGCQNKESTVEYEIKDGRKSYTTKFGYTAYVIPVEMDNGAKCVLVMYESGHGAAISCDWGRANLTETQKAIISGEVSPTDAAAALPRSEGSSGKDGGL